MKIQLVTYLTTLTFFIFSCSPILKTISGIRDIRIETTDDFFSGSNSVFLPLDSTVTLSCILSNYRNIESDSIARVDTADFYLVYFWAKWHRKLTKNSVEDIRSILSNANDSTTIQSFYLNNDFVSVNYPDDIDFKKLKVKLSF